MAYDYANDPMWGSDYRRALASGDQNYLQRLQRTMDNNTAAQGTAGQIMANTLNMGRTNGADTWANGAAGTQVNGLGQIRTGQPAQGWNVTPGGGSSLYNYQGQQAPSGPSNIIGQAQGTMTQDQYGASQQPRQMYGASPTTSNGSSFDPNTINNFYRKGVPETTKPFSPQQPPQWSPGSVFGQGGQFGGLGALQQLLQRMQGGWGQQGGGWDGVYDSWPGSWGGAPWQQGGGVSTDPSAGYGRNNGINPGGSYYGANWDLYTGGGDSGMAQISMPQYRNRNTGQISYDPWSSGQQQPDQGMMMDTHGMYRPQQTNWGGGYGSRQGMFNAGPLSQMFNSGWRR